MRGATPALTSAASPSPTARMLTASSALFTALSASPAPTGPTCSMRRPNASSTGRARANVAASAPTITVSVAGLGAVGAAAHRRVREGHAPLGEPSRDPPRGRRVARGAVEEQRARPEAREQPVRAVEQPDHVGRGAEAGDDDLGRAAASRGVAAAVAPWRAANSVARDRGPVPDREAATTGEVRGHRGADGAETEEADVHQTDLSGARAGERGRRKVARARVDGTAGPVRRHTSGTRPG